MSYLLTAPTAVLVLSRGDGLARAIEDGDVPAGVGAVYGADSVDAAIETVEERDDVGVAVVTADVDEPVETTCERLRAADDRLPVVASLDPEDGEALAAATQAGAETVVAAGDRSGLADAVEDAVERYQRRRRESADRRMFSTLLEEIGVSIYAKDENARHLRLANVSGGPDPKYAIGKTDAELYGDEEGADETRTDDERVIEEGEPIRGKVEHFEAEGTDVWTKTTKVPWRDEDGEVQGLVGLSLNITDEVEKERRIKAFEDRFDTFASNLSHDLKSPLQVASGHLEIAQETGDDEAFEKVASSLDRMEEMIDDISLLATSEGDPAFETFDEESVVEEITDPANFTDVVEEIWEVVGVPEATLVNRFSPEALIVATEGTIRPMLENLLRNAVQHAGPDARIELGPLPHWDGFYVADDGPGIPPDEREQVFAEGYTSREGGTGTGLSIVAEAVEQHNWTIDVSESADDGARFEVGNCPMINEPDRDLTGTESVSLSGGVDVGEFEGETGERYDPDADRWTITSAGTNIWRHDNEFRFVQAEVEGGVRIQGRIPEPAALNEYSKSGFMIRDDVDADAAYGAVVATPRYGTELLWRRAAGLDGVSHQFGEEVKQFAWYRVDRVDDVVTCYCSTDGDHWYPIGQRRIELADPVHVGMAVCSVVAGSSADATFEDVTVERLATDD